MNFVITLSHTTIYHFSPTPTGSRMSYIYVYFRRPFSTIDGAI